MDLEGMEDLSLAQKEARWRTKYRQRQRGGKMKHLLRDPGCWMEELSLQLGVGPGALQGVAFITTRVRTQGL